MSKKFLLAAFAILAVLVPGSASAQVSVGPQISFGGDTDLGLGVRVLANVESLDQWDFIGTFDVFFPDDGPNNDVSYWEANANLAYNFVISDAPSISPYVGGGLNIAHVNVENSAGDFDNTDLGLNLFFGTQFEGDSFTPFVEVRGVIDGGDQVVVTGGLLF